MGSLANCPVSAREYESTGGFRMACPPNRGRHKALGGLGGAALYALDDMFRCLVCHMRPDGRNGRWLQSLEARAMSGPGDGAEGLAGKTT